MKVTRNYQITIPAEIRRKMGLKLGDVVEVVYDENRKEVVIRKVKKLRAGRKLTLEEIEELIAEGLSGSI